jgi:hypothetical protein
MCSRELLSECVLLRGSKPPNGSSSLSLRSRLTPNGPWQRKKKRKTEHIAACPAPCITDLDLYSPEEVLRSEWSFFFFALELELYPCLFRNKTKKPETNAKKNQSSWKQIGNREAKSLEMNIGRIYNRNKNLLRHVSNIIPCYVDKNGHLKIGQQDKVQFTTYIIV